MTPAKILLICAAALALCSPGARLAAQANGQPRLWVGMSVDQPLYHTEGIERLTISFAVVNDGNTTVDPGVGSSHLFINGVEPADWIIVVNNGPRGMEFNALPPGKGLGFGYQLGGRYFTKPGNYTLRWEVGNFRSADVTFRVVEGRW